VRDPRSRIAEVSVVHGAIRYRGEMNHVATWDVALGARLDGDVTTLVDALLREPATPRRARG
jgi:hypothetical protein